MKNNRLILSFAASLFLFPLAFGSMGGCSRQDALDGAGQALKMDLTFPKGYTYDRGSQAVYGPSGKLNAALPSYVTGITLTISGEGMDAVTLPVDPNTLSVSFTVTPGIRTFTILVTTSIGLSFTDSVTVEVTSGAPVRLRFSLVVNAPPSITAISANPVVATPGRMVALSCSASDLDPDDQLTYQWSGPGFSASGPSASFTVPGYGYFTLTCAVNDGRGGAASSTVSVTAPAPNLPPYVTRFFMADANTGAAGTLFWGNTMVTLTCVGGDPEKAPVIYKLSGPGFNVDGPTLTFQLSNNCNYVQYVENYVCIVSDGVNKPVSYGMSITVEPGC